MSNLKKLKHPYGYVANTIINDKRLTYTAKGIYLYILSKPDSWDFSQKRIADDSATSEYSVRKAVKELEDSNLLERSKLPNGRVIYLVRDPVQECVFQKTNTTSGTKKNIKSQKMNTQPANTQPANTGGISKKELKVRKIKSKTDNKSGDLKSDHKEICQIIKDFEEIDPKNKNYYTHIGKKRNCDFLIQNYGYENVRNIIKFYKFALTQKDSKSFEIRKRYRYLPEITSPYDLQEKWIKFASFVRRAKEDNEEMVNNLVM